MGRGQDHQPSVGQEGKPHCQRGCSLFYWSAGLHLTGTLGWDPSHSSGALSPAAVGMLWASGGKYRSNSSCRQLPVRTARTAPGCFSQGKELKVLLPLVPSHRHWLDVAPESHLPAPSQSSVYNWEMLGSFLCTIHLLPAAWTLL